MGIIITISSLILCIIIYIISKNNQRKTLILHKLKHKKEVLNIQSPIKKCNKVYDYMIEDEKIYLIKVLCVPFHNKVSFNSKFVVETHVVPNRLGAPITSIKRVKGIEAFQKLKLNTDKEVVKVIAIYPGNVEIKMYLNESSIKIIKGEDIVYNFALWRI